MVLKGCFANGPDFEWDLEAQPFEIRAEMSGFWMVGTKTTAKPYHLKSDLQKVWISNGQISLPYFFKALRASKSPSTIWLMMVFILNFSQNT